MDPALRSVLRPLVPTVYAPFAGVFLGLGMLVPTLPLYLTDRGASFTLTALVVAAASVGGTLGGLPMSTLVARWGTGRALLVTTLMLTVSIASLGATDVIAVLAVAQVAIGVAQSGFVLSRQTLLRSRVPLELFGRTNALVGGTNRLSFLLGPLLGGFLAELVGFRWTFVCAAIVALAGSAAGYPGALERRVRPEQSPVALGQVLRDHGRLVLRAGLGPALITGARRGRFVLLPLIGDSIGLSAGEIGAVVAIGTGADLCLFPVSGFVMDRYGRLASIVPSFSLMAVGLVLLGTVDSTSGVIFAGAVIGVGNGLSSGTMLTYAADLAPDDAPAQFMAALSAIQGVGGIAGTLLVGVLADVVDLGAAAIATGAALALGVVCIIVLVGETGPRSLSRSH